MASLQRVRDVFKIQTVQGVLSLGPGSFAELLESTVDARNAVDLIGIFIAPVALIDDLPDLYNCFANP